MNILSELYQQKSNAFSAIVYHTGMCIGIPVVTMGAIFVSGLFYLLCSHHAVDRGTTARSTLLAEGVVVTVGYVSYYVCPLITFYHFFCIPFAVYRWWIASSSIEALLPKLI